MPDFIHSLQSRDLGHLRIVAELWGVELTSVEANAARKELATLLLDKGMVREIVDSLTTEPKLALQALAKAGGKIPWAAFARRFGEIRDAGPGRRDREHVHLNPISPAETLFYRALLERAFFDTPSSPQEFAYIPDDLLALIPQEDSWSGQASLPATGESPLGRSASPKERKHPLPFSDRILDDACTYLAAMRLGWQTSPYTENWRYPTSILTDLLTASQLIADSTPQPESIKSFLEAHRKEALETLVRAWRLSGTFNELHHVPGLICDGEWVNQPLATREFLLNLISFLPRGQWWSLSAFIRLVKEKFPDFQRPAGDYDSWFIKRSSDGTYLRGFSFWDDVDGALIRYIISGPMFWLGIVELATPGEGAAPSAFRLATPGSQPSLLEKGKLHVTSQGRVDVPRLLPRSVRYQIARFCEWEDEKEDEYRYRVTPRSLYKANQQGLKVEQMLGLLKKHAAAPIPSHFVRALKRWEMKGIEARVENQTVLRVGSPKVLEELRGSKAGRFLGDSLGPVVAIVKPGAQSRVLAALAELGILAQDETKADEFHEG